MTKTANGTAANRRRYDVIVVGAGIAGSLVAKRGGLRGRLGLPGIPVVYGRGRDARSRGSRLLPVRAEPDVIDASGSTPT